jgi:hypothetical protein
MAEPTSTSGVTLIVLLTAFLGPLAGPYAVIVMGSLLGAMWPLSTMHGTTKIGGAFFLFRIITAALILTIPTAWHLETSYGFPAIHGMAVVAFAIGAMGNGWTTVLNALKQGLAALARGIGGASSGDQK